MPKTKNALIKGMTKAQLLQRIESLNQQLAVMREEKLSARNALIVFLGLDERMDELEESIADIEMRLSNI